MGGDPTVRTAFALARSGNCAGVEDIRRQLKMDNHDQVDAHLASPSLSRQLRDLCLKTLAINQRGAN